MAKKSASDGSRFLIVAGVAAIVLALAFAASKYRGTEEAKDSGSPAPSQTVANVVPVASSSASGALDASAASVATTDTDAGTNGDAGDGGGLDAAAGTGGFVVDRALAPWFIESHTVDRGVGTCGGMESTTTPRLRFQGDGGALVRELASIDDSCPHGVSRTNTVEKIFDFDGDGAPELMVVTQTTGPTGISAEESAIWTVKAASIVPYRFGDAAAPPPFAAVDDVDGDGRPDLLSRLTYTDVGSMPCGSGFLVAPIFMFHSRPGGSFTRTDAVAKKHLEDACGTDSLEDLLEAEGEIGTAVVCARVRGQGVDGVMHKLANGCSKFSDVACDPTANDAGKRTACPSWALTLAKQPTPAP